MGCSSTPRSRRKPTISSGAAIGLAGLAAVRQQPAAEQQHEQGAGERNRQPDRGHRKHVQSWPTLALQDAAGDQERRRAPARR
jgi:hypothetical protein